MASCHLLFACSAASLSSFLDLVHYVFDRLIDNLTNNRTKPVREFEIRETRYVNYRYVVVGEFAISLPTQFCSKGMASYPELTYLYWL